MLAKTVCRGCLRQLHSRAPVYLTRRWQSTTADYSQLQTEMPIRKLPILYEDLTTRNAHNLNVSLASFLPKGWLSPDAYGGPLPSSDSTSQVDPGWHLVYFNPALPASKLLPDGTDPNQSPGGPFVRRMWAGGQVRFNPKKDSQGSRVALSLDGKRYACVEGIRDVIIKGKPGSEKVFVGIERRFGPAGSDNEETLRSRLWSTDQEQFNEAVVIERRNIVFMHERTPDELQAIKDAGAAPPPSKMLRPPNTPAFTHTLTPTATLLFRYSALTFNAHAIHLDPNYCRTVEAHRDLLVHGPLTFTLLTTMLNSHIGRGKRGKFIDSIEYRNLAPLYANEPLKLCGREVDELGTKYEIWAETPNGGIAVKGTAKVGE
ncbi:hypothetical protein FKW77_010171 [Venturia effusa]|uniref:MaoC-like domain-containing protein n=1 Tax=Venturia effusa TaxID=50376 RepID=A0A517L4F7_9PEZI|nr:hypothetical protein FKW77_010171 [Venturia effusa]